MTGNIKKPCPYCQEKITSTQVLRHIFTYHLETVFSEENQAGRLNRSRLKNSSHKPFSLETADHSEYYCCFGCRTACAKLKSAENHFAKEECRKGHAEAVKDMLAKYPNTKPVYGKAGASEEVATDLSGSITTTTTTTTTVIKADPEILKHFLKSIQGKARTAIWDKNTLSKKLAKLQKRYNIPQEEIDDISDASGTDDEKYDDDEDNKKDDPVEYPKEKSFSIAEWEHWKKYARVLGIPAFSAQEINEANLKKALQNPDVSKLYWGK